MTKFVKSAGFVFAAAVFAASSAYALTAPTLKAAGFSNGKLTVCVEKTPISSSTLEVQMKDQGAADSEYATIITKTVSSLSTFPWNNYDGAYALYTTNFAGTATLRMRAVSGEETSEWVDMGDFPAYINVTGTRIGTATQTANALDGNMFSMVDESTNPWLGYDFGETIRVRGFRFYPRPDLIGRIDGAKVQYASDASFSDATTVYTASSSTISKTRITEIFFEEPVDVRCARILSSTRSDGRSSVCEFEVIPADAPWKPSISVARDDITNFYPVVTWTIPSEMASTSVDVLRATSAAGPFTAVVSGIDPVANSSCTDASAKVGVPYYYMLRANCNHPSFPGQTVHSSVVTYRRWRRLDRSWFDEAHLYDGVSILTQTNGAAFLGGGRGFDLAFDGIKTSDNRVDATGDVRMLGPLGLDFGESAWVGAVGYVCRWDNWCFVRVQNGALFCASGNDVELKDKTLCSENMSVATQDDSFHFQESTSMPNAGAPWWFLYGNNVNGNGFYCNVSELAFFGWTQHDLDAAGIVAAPDSLSLERSADGLSVVASWSAGVNAASYRLERRARGGDAWAQVAMVAGGVQTASDSSMTQGYWEYRVVAIGDGGDESSGAVCPYAYYAPGNGTGLKGSIYSPYAADVAALSNPAERHDIPEGNVNLSVARGNDLVAGTGVKTNAYLLWRGKIIAPFAGSYDFTLETSDGGALFIDGVSVANSWTGGTKTPSGSIDLTVGEHTIEVDARLQFSYAGPSKCILRWGGVVPTEVVPATQLVPADSALLEFDGWDLRHYSGRKIGKAVKIDGGYKLTGPRDLPASRNEMHATFLAKPWRYSLDISGFVTASGNGRGGFMVRAANGNVFGVSYDYNGDGDGFCVVTLVTNGSNSVAFPIGKQQVPGRSNLGVYLRLVREFDTGRFTAYWKDDNDPDWFLLYEWTDDGSFKGDCEYGLFVTGYTSNALSGFNFTQLSMDTSRPGLAIIFR